MEGIGRIVFNQPQEVQKAGSKETQQKLDKLTKKSQEILLKISAVFPFDLFPDDVVIDVEKVSIVTGEFFASKQIYSIPIIEIKDVIVETIPLFASLKITDYRYPNQSTQVSFLKKDEAIKAKRIILGLVTAIKNEVDLSNIERSFLLEKLEELGKVTEET